MNIHPRPACGIFAVLYSLIVCLLEKIFKIHLFDNIITYIILLILSGFVYKFFLDRYDGIE